MKLPSTPVESFILEVSNLVWKVYRIFEIFGGSKQLNICDPIVNGRIIESIDGNS